MAATADKPKYVYGVVRAGGSAVPAVAGIAGKPLELVAEGKVAALASPAPAAYLEAGKEELLTHSRVLEAAMEEATVLPMRFGVVVPDARTLRERLLGPHHEELTAQLAAMDGKVEISVKGIYDEAIVLREIVAGEREISTLRDSIQGKPEDATYFERLRLGELVSAAFAARREQDAATIVERLRPYAGAVEVADQVHERMAVNASFLVDRDALGRFNRAVDEAAEAQGGRIRFKYVGPLPPHSFVELEVAS
jgi:hypothetical protein